jgi:ATP-dependent DNA ligase
MNPTGVHGSRSSASTVRNMSLSAGAIPKGSRHRIGALLLGYYTPQGQLVYVGRAGTGMPEAELERLWQRLQPLVVDKMPLAEPPPRGTRFGSPLVFSRVHWAQPEMVVEVSFVVVRSSPHAGEA